MYKLLIYHMNPDPNYLFGHAEIAGMLAGNHDKVATFDKYRRECQIRGVTYYSEACYMQFMMDCKREVKNAILLKIDMNNAPECGKTM